MFSLEQRRLWEDFSVAFQWFKGPEGKMVTDGLSGLVGTGQGMMG